MLYFEITWKTCYYLIISFFVFAFFLDVVAFYSILLAVESESESRSRSRKDFQPEESEL